MLSSTAETAAPQPTEHHYFCRRKSILWFLPVVLGAAGVLWLAWMMLDAAFKLDMRPRGLRGKAAMIYLIVLLLVVLPVWIRVPFLVAAAGHILWLGTRRLMHAFDDLPDFLIGPEGVGGWDRFTFRRIPWPEVSRVVIDDKSKLIRIYGPEVGPRRFFGTFPPRRCSIFFSQRHFDAMNVEILFGIRQFRPDLVKDTAAQSR